MIWEYHYFRKHPYNDIQWIFTTIFLSNLIPTTKIPKLQISKSAFLTVFLLQTFQLWISRWTTNPFPKKKICLKKPKGGYKLQIARLPSALGFLSVSHRDIPWASHTKVRWFISKAQDLTFPHPSRIQKLEIDPQKKRNSWLTRKLQPFESMYLMGILHLDTLRC